MGLKQFAAYSAEDVIFTVGGVPIDSGRGDDEFLSISKTEDEVTYKASVDGDGTTSTNKNTYHEVTLTMMQTAKGNAVLTGIHKLGKSNSKGFVVVPIGVLEKGSLGDVFVAAEAWIKKFPDETRAKETGTVQWVFGVHNPERAIMGH